MDVDGCKRQSAFLFWTWFNNQMGESAAAAAEAAPRVHGRGKWGETIDVVSEGGRRGADGGTMVADLARLQQDEQRCTAWAVVADGRGGVAPLRRVTTTVGALLAASRRYGRGLVAKRMRAEARTAFDYELKALSRVRDAYRTTAAVARFTALGVLPGVACLPPPAAGRPRAARDRPPADAQVRPRKAQVRPRPAQVQAVRLADGRGYILSRRCEAPLDRFVFTTDREADAFVAQLLASFADLHAGGLLHCDVKLDNMIWCARERRFKLIDWGASSSVAQLTVRYLRTLSRPRNFASPLAWVAWGAGRAFGTPAVYTGNLLLRYAAAAGGALLDGRFLRLVFSALLSCRAAADREFERGVQRGRWAVDTDAAFRRHIMLRYARSLDLFGFGLAVAYVACVSPEGGLSDGVRARMLELARRLTHAGDDGAFTQDAGEALAWWRSSASA
jgi:hypothetical protein